MEESRFAIAPNSLGEGVAIDEVGPSSILRVAGERRPIHMEFHHDANLAGDLLVLLLESSAQRPLAVQRRSEIAEGAEADFLGLAAGVMADEENQVDPFEVGIFRHILQNQVIHAPVAPDQRRPVGRVERRPIERDQLGVRVDDLSLVGDQLIRAVAVATTAERCPGCGADCRRIEVR